MDERQFQTWLLGQLRRISKRQPGGPGTEAYQRARVGYGQYRCSACSGIFGPKEVHREHTQCVVPLDGFDNWTGVIERLFCRKEGIQDSTMLTIMCIECHKKKSKEEAAIRAKYRRARAGKN